MVVASYFRFLEDSGLGGRKFVALKIAFNVDAFDAHRSALSWDPGKRDKDGDGVFQKKNDHIIELERR